MNINFSEMSKAKLHRYGAHTVGAAMEIHISEKDVTPLEASSCRYWFRIGEMYFDLILNEDSTMSLYVSNENDDVSIQIASFQANGSIIRGVTERSGREILPNEKYYVVKYCRCNKENVCYDCMKGINGEDETSDRAERRPG